MDGGTLLAAEGFKGSSDDTGSFLKPGATIGRYRIIDVVGHGGMGVLYRAHDPSLDRVVALKSPWSESIAEPTAIRRFLREARTAAKLSHPHIVSIHDVFEHDGLPWLAMQLVRGRDLRNLLAEVQESTRSI